MLHKELRSTSDWSTCTYPGFFQSRRLEIALVNTGFALLLGSDATLPVAPNLSTSALGAIMLPVKYNL